MEPTQIILYNVLQFDANSLLTIKPFITFLFLNDFKNDNSLIMNSRLPYNLDHSLHTTWVKI